MPISFLISAVDYDFNEPKTLPMHQMKIIESIFITRDKGLFREVPASNVMVTCSITDSMPDKFSFINHNSKTDSNNEFQLGPLLPGMEKKYWVFIENERYRKAMEGKSNIFTFIYFLYLFSGGKSGYDMISQLDNKIDNFVHKEMWID
jgi:hypothetical protein